MRGFDAFAGAIKSRQDPARGQDGHPELRPPRTSRSSSSARRTPKRRRTR
jgi:hypothetical protein